MTPGTKMKQLQWDKVPQTAVAKTLWQADTPDKEKEWLNKLKDEGILRQMEEDFHAKQTVINLMGRFESLRSFGSAKRYFTNSASEESRTQERPGPNNEEARR